MIINKKPILSAAALDAQYIIGQCSVEILAAINAVSGELYFDQVRQTVAAQNLNDDKGEAITAERLPDGVIHQICADNGVEVSQ